jgi:hypothetical protein
MPERGLPAVVSQHPGRRVSDLIAVVVALSFFHRAGASPSAGAATVAQQLSSLQTIQPFNGETTSASQFGPRGYVGIEGLTRIRTFRAG